MTFDGASSAAGRKSARSTAGFTTTDKMDIFDPLRKKYVKLTPEEEVRQMVIHWLIEERGCPVTLMASEYSFRYNGLNYRADIVVFDRTLKPLLMVECKAPDIKLDKNVTEQVIRYNRVLGVRFILICNGRNACFLAKDDASGEYTPMDDIPDFTRMTGG